MLYASTHKAFFLWFKDHTGQSVPIYILKPTNYSQARALPVLANLACTTTFLFKSLCEHHFNTCLILLLLSSHVP